MKKELISFRCRQISVSPGSCKKGLYEVKTNYSFDEIGFLVRKFIQYLDKQENSGFVTIADFKVGEK